jgi:ornithine--oxo-acid transaminase
MFGQQSVVGSYGQQMPIEVTSSSALYSDHVNPQWVKLLDELGMNLRYTRCSGVELFAENGNCILDFLSGYCVHNVGHNHPSVNGMPSDVGHI